MAGAGCPLAIVSGTVGPGRVARTTAMMAIVVAAAAPTSSAIRRSGRAERRARCAVTRGGRSSAADRQLAVHQGRMDRAFELVGPGLQRRHVVGLLRGTRE